MCTPSSLEWRDEDSSGAVAAGWSSKDDGNKIPTSRAPTTPMSQWGPAIESSWGNKPKVSVSRIRLEHVLTCMYSTKKLKRALCTIHISFECNISFHC